MGAVRLAMNQLLLWRDEDVGEAEEVPERDGGCEALATEIVQLADEPRALGIFVRKNTVDPALGDRIARKFDSDSQNPNKSRRGAATKLRLGKDETAMSLIDEYVAGVQKTKVLAGSEGLTLGLIDDALFLRDCVPGLPLP